MRIPLDYYRILGLPIQATTEQLQQAYRDRALQLPRREYSEVAIAARRQLLDQAYAVLADPEQRAAYDGNFLNHVFDQPSEDLSDPTSSPHTEVDPFTPSLEITEEQFVGAILILYDLGEYELVLKLSRPYLSSGNLRSSLDQGHLGEAQLVRADIVLTIGLACLELGREQWQQTQYENAATSLETGQKLLLSEGLFPTVRGEIQADLYKLRPYRVLELLALPTENATERRHGLAMLQDMLQERGGIDGAGEDQSGLSIDDFLRFIQQLRGYLTASEQEALFESEAKRPSAVATYLAVYALMARGFCQRQPALIVRAKQLLMRLGKRQDVHLEQAVCALLLGQTEQATRALELSQEYQSLAFIRENSQGSPDLLPGLCLYGERWLQTEVFPHFRDLSTERVSLKDYFADPEIQAYLENLPAEVDSADDWAVVEAQRVAYSSTSATSPEMIASTTSNGSHQFNGVGLGKTGKHQVNPHGATEPPPNNQPHAPKQPLNIGDYQQGNALEPSSAKSNYTSQVPSSTGSTSSIGNIPSLPSSQQTFSSQPRVEFKNTNLPSVGNPTRRRRQPRIREKADTSLANGQHKTEFTSDAFSSIDDLQPSPTLVSGRRTRSHSKHGANNRRVIFLTLAGIFSLGVLGFLLIRVLQTNSKTPPNAILEAEQPLVQLDKPPVPIPAADSAISYQDGLLTEDTATEVIETWLSSKAQAMGETHQVEPLAEILVDPVLSRWQ
ncbi:MAG: DnaJ domain-containing protein, partial [Crinalium sp.]